MTPEKMEEISRDGSRRVLATLIRVLGDFDLAEEATQEAFATALKSWSRNGVPDNPVAWLVKAGRFKALDILKRKARYRELEPQLQLLTEEVEAANRELSDRDVVDDRLRLVFTCCHPAIDPTIQIPLTLREVCGLSTEEIARAFLVKPATMAQRIVRGKSKIRNAGIPYVVPSKEDLPERLESVLDVIYLVFNEGYSHQAPLAKEAIRLGRLLAELLPDPEVDGLLALMLLHESRRRARQGSAGQTVLLEEQDRSLWDQDLIREGRELVQRSLATQRFGAFTVQAAISAVHSHARTPEQTDWAQIVGLYDLLSRLDPGPVVELNRAVAIAMRDGFQAGLPLIEEIQARGQLGDYALAHSARAGLLRRLGRDREAAEAFQEALGCIDAEVQKPFIQSQLQEL